MLPIEVLISFAGLPAVGKTTIAKSLANELGAVYLRADTVEQVLRNYGLSETEIGGMGYGVLAALAAENLRYGRSVVIDTVNPWGLTRQMFREAAERAASHCVEIEIICTDLIEHRRRAESRISDIVGHNGPTWDEIIGREYHPWDTRPLTLDTAKLTSDECVRMILDRLTESA